jgi:hypothetical protein
MLRLFVLAVAIASAGVSASVAKDQLVGRWLVSEKEDRFDKGGTFTAATPDGATKAFIVRCIENELSLAILDMGDDPHPFAAGDKFRVNLRVDKLPIIETDGTAISTRLIQLDTTKYMVQVVRDGREIATRVRDKTSSLTNVFKLDGAKKALARIVKECPLD